MKYLKLFLIALAVIFVVYIFFSANSDRGKNQQTGDLEQTTQNNLETKTDEQGQVTVAVAPLSLESSQWKFDVTFNTHSVELDQDPIQISELYDNTGTVYKPIAWEGAGPGGHHREGILVFQPINPKPASVELKIKDVGGVPDRSFKWNLK